MAHLNLIPVPQLSKIKRQCGQRGPRGTDRGNGPRRRKGRL